MGPVLLNGRDHFWYGVQLAEFIDPIGCQDGLVIQFFLADADPAHLVTNCPDILFCVVHMSKTYLSCDTIKRWLKKDEDALLF